MRRAMVLVLLCLAAGVFAQRAPAPIRLRIRHADPWMVKAALEGRQVLSPEISAIANLFGRSPLTGEAVNAAFSGGVFVVNPTDNSLWFFPNRR